jgi:hypothetical protein
MNIRNKAYFLILVVVLLVPRIARILYPEIWLESEPYLNSAFLLSKGFKPYVEFSQAHFPLPESILSILFVTFGPTLRTVEIFTQLLIFLSSLLIFQIGKLSKGTLTGVIAAIIFASSYVIFRYHIFEREIYVTAVMLLCVYVLFRNHEFGDRLPALLAVLVVLGLLCKLTAIAYVPAIVIYLYASFGKKSTVRFIFITSSIFILVIICFYLVYGKSFLIQVFLFRMLHGFTRLVRKWPLFAEVLDLNLVLGLPGLLILLKDRTRKSLMIIALFASTFVFDFVLNPTFWPHNGIEMLPWLSIAGGALVQEIVQVTKSMIEKRPFVLKRSLFVYLGLPLLLWVFVFPVQISDWGFGFRQRVELNRIASFIESQTLEDEVILTPPIFPFLAKRVEIVPYTEIAGTMIDLEAKVKKYGLLETIRRTPKLRFEDGMINSQKIWLPEVLKKIHERRLKIVINPSPFDKGYLTDFVPEDFLKASKYQVTFMTDHYKVWTPRQ